MSQEIAITAIIQPAEGKLERVSCSPNSPIEVICSALNNPQLKELLGESIEWIKANEPGTLEFSSYEVNTDEGVKFVLFERYASEEAMKQHESTPEYRKVFETMTAEQMLAGAPMILRSLKAGPGFRR